MGEQRITESTGEVELRAFTRALLDDVRALEHLLSSGQFETGTRRIGAEQEGFLVDARMRPACVAERVIEEAGDPRLTTELARFNIEANLSPRVLGGTCLSAMAEELTEVTQRLRDAAALHGAQVLLAGSLPTLGKGDLDLANMTPLPRYRELNRVLTRLRGGDFHIAIKGLDELDITHDNVMFEACNASFQVHFQVGPEEFAKLYNLAQAVTAPVLAAAVNSPVLLKRRLWAETRVALFERSLDTRKTAEHARGRRPRVHFGDHWVRESVLELFREDIARFRVMLTGHADEDPKAVLDRGGVPDLTALRTHNGTVYRWNRAVYGITDGVPHLRIEHRVLPSGPTITDQIANAAFFFGLMAFHADEHPRIDKEMRFDDAKSNFFAAARHGLKAQFTWFGGRTCTASELVLDHLLPQARDGLARAKIAAADIDEYLGVIEARVRTTQTGARWVQQSLASMEEGTPEVRYRHLTECMLRNQMAGTPVHEWSLARVQGGPENWSDSFKTVGQFMTTDVFTVRPGDIVDLAANVMEWEHIRYVPVEDDDGALVGMVSLRALIRMAASARKLGSTESLLISSVMTENPRTVTPETSTLDALAIMRSSRVSCLPVVEAGKLVGLISALDLLDVLVRFMERHFDRASSPPPADEG